MDSKEITKIAYKALEDKKAVDIRIIDIRNISIVADYFIITGGTNQNQVHALADGVDEELAKIGCHSHHIEGYATANWVLMDYGDVIVHVFNQEDRFFYDLERIWRDGKNISIEEL